MIKKPASVALVMIVKNEATCIARCLSSIAGHVQQMIVLDTGSTDATPSIAAGFGASVYHYPWNNDFAAARNCALAYSTADWNLILDADEWIASGHGVLSALEAATYVGQIAITSSFINNGLEESSTEWISRLLPAGVRYTGRVHEQPDNSEVFLRRRLGLYVGHDGYLSRKLAIKQGRNEALLQLAIEENPRDPYLLYQLGKDLAVYEKHDEASAYFLNALSLTSEADAYRHDLVVRGMYSLKRAGKHDEAIRLGSEEFGKWPDSPDYFFCLSDVFLDWAVLHPEKAETEFLPIVESGWLKCLEIGDNPALSGTVLGRGSFLAATNLAVLYENTGRHEEAVRYQNMAQAMRGTTIQPTAPKNLHA